MTTKPKRMLVHVYQDGQWVSHEYPSLRAMQRSLRSEGITFGQNATAGLGMNSIVLMRKDKVLEIEEAVDDDGGIPFRGKAYIPVKAWAEAHGSTVRKARYAYKAGKLEGMTVGNRNYLYIREDA